MDVRQYADLFLTESRDHLTAFNHLLLEWERDPAAPEPVGGIFRAVHTIKGMAATMGYGAVADLSHRIENLLDVLRRGEKPATPATLELLFKSADALDRAIADAVAGKDAAAPLQALIAQLDREAGTGAAPATPGRQRPSAPVMMPEAGPGRGRTVRVALRPQAALKGARAILAIRKAEALGAVSAVAPAPAAMETEGFDGTFSFRLDSEADAVVVEEALRAAGDVDTVEVAEELHEVVAEGVRARHIRVDLRRLDELMNQIGELVIARGRLASLTSRLAEPDLDEVALQIGRLAGRLQSEIIQARMTPVWQVFDRFPRMVRDLAKQMGKQVAFRVEGKEIELDRTILDELADPLVHLLRNAVDHGIEPSEDRVARGKPAVGQLVVAAVRERSSVAIRVSDDGRGVNRAAVLARAREMGLVAADQQELGEQELFRVLTRSGFSTARAVTDVSGRGVGIDVVSTAARALGGSLEIRTEEGKGTTFTLRLPVTLAIVRALLARVGSELYALPLTHVAETVDPKPEEIHRVQGRETVLLRGRLLPLVRLHEVLGGSAAAPAAQRLPVIVLEMGERRTGVVVDALVGQQEIVVKNFEAPRGMLPLFSGATILGDGVPALILDAGGLM
ncbi:MAG: chemotaxis protein CheA [Gemmatimonadetes bacterium]|nr:chemotaxis protein CheA [Gemmatimonadota bacterium]